MIDITYQDDVIENYDTCRSKTIYGVIIGTHSPFTPQEIDYADYLTETMYRQVGVYISSIEFHDRIVALKIHAKPSISPLEIVNKFKMLSSKMFNDDFQEMDSSYSFYWFEDYFITTEELTINDLNDFRAARIV